MTKETVKLITDENLEDYLINKFVSDDLKEYINEKAVKNQLSKNYSTSSFFNDKTIKSLMQYSWFKNRDDIILTTLNSIYSRMSTTNQQNKTNGILEYNSLPYKSFLSSYKDTSKNFIKIICDNVVDNPNNYSISTYRVSKLIYNYFIPELFSFGINALEKNNGLLSNAIVGENDNVINIGHIGLHYENPYYALMLLQDIFSDQKLISFNQNYMTFLEKNVPYTNLPTDFMLNIKDVIEDYVKNTSNYFEKDDNHRIRQYTLALNSVENNLKNFLFNYYKTVYYDTVMNCVFNENSKLIEQMRSENKKLMQNSNVAFGWS
jgi:hypothetical protein